MSCVRKLSSVCGFKLHGIFYFYLMQYSCKHATLGSKATLETVCVASQHTPKRILNLHAAQMFAANLKR